MPDAAKTGMMDQTEEDDMATVTLVIVTYNSSGALAGCAASLAAVEVVGGYELIIVDNASRDDSVAQVRAHVPGARLIENAQNRGFAAAVNQGVAAGTGRIVATLNPDTEVTAGWLQALVERLDADAGIGVVGSVIRDADGQVTHTAGTVDAVTYRTGHADGAAGSLDDVAYVTGAGIALRRADWDALGGFDEGFFPAYFEDLDLCLRVRARGQRCVVVATAHLLHRESSSTGKYSGAFYYYYHRNRLRMVRKQLSRAALYGSFVQAEAQAQSVGSCGLTTQRTPFFCSGCPHNTSTQLPEGSRGLAGIGCHGMVQMLPKRNTITITQMGGEGATWIGLAPFTSQRHVFQNLGDGTYQHSGLLAIRAAAAAGVNITYKILYNAAVAMTGGQAIEGGPSVVDITRQVRAEGAKKVVVVTDDPDKYPSDVGFAPDVGIYHRKDLDRVQRELREIPGLTVLVYDQGCAAEKRRTRKQVSDAMSKRHVVINAAVCEGCGDCSRASNCMSVVPVETEFGRKRMIDQSGCNKDFSCVEGFCPSFVTLSGATPRRLGRDGATSHDPAAGLPLPVPLALERPYGILVTGVGGTGVLTLGALLGMAAHLEGRGCSVLDFTGMAQKNGAVTSHIRVARQPSELNAVRLAQGDADVVLACDALVAAGESVLLRCNPGVTRVVVNRHLQPTAAFVANNNVDLQSEQIERAIESVCGADRVAYVRATALATALAGDAIAANLLMLGFAFQRGLLPVGLASIERAIELNAVAVEANKKIFAWGRLAAHDPARLARLSGASVPDQVPAAMTLVQLMARHEQELEAYQNSAYAARYRALLDRVATREQAIAPGSDALTGAVARNLFKLMAYKDEYEVARLFANGRFMDKLKREFEGDIRLEFHLAIPLITDMFGAKGKPLKRSYGGWMLRAFGLLSYGKSLRGTPLDPFGYSEERRFERALLADYVSQVEALLNGLSPDTLNLAVKLAMVPERIRGFGHIKRQAALEAKTMSDELLTAFRAAA